MNQKNKARAVVYIRTATTDPENPIRLRALDKGWKELAGADYEIVRIFKDLGDSDMTALDQLISFCKDEENEIETVIMAEAEKFGKDVVESLSRQDIGTCRMELRVIRSFFIGYTDDGEMGFARNPRVLTDTACEHALVESHTHA